MTQSPFGPFAARHDRRGVPIYPGDLLRTPHFRDRRRRQNYLYHVAVDRGTHLEMVPTHHLIGPEGVRDGGQCWLTVEMAAAAEVISGIGVSPLDCPLDVSTWWTDRPRRKPTSTVSA